MTEHNDAFFTPARCAALYARLAPDAAAQEALRRRLETEETATPRHGGVRLALRATAAAVAAVAIVCTLVWMGEDKPVPMVDPEERAFHAENSYRMGASDWEERSLGERYTDLSRDDGRTYSLRDWKMTFGNQVSPIYLGEALGTATATGVEHIIGQEDVPHETTVTIYALQDVDPEMAMAIQHAGDEDYYLAVGNDWSFATLGELLERAGIADAGCITLIWNNQRVNYLSPDVTDAWGRLMSDTALPVVNGGEIGSGMLLCLQTNRFICQDIFLFDDGRAQFCLINGNTATVDLGRGKIDAFVEYVRTHLTPEVVPTAPPGSPTTGTWHAFSTTN